MKTYLIQRNIPGVGKLNAEERKGIAVRSCNVLDQLNASEIQWIQSLITPDNIWCIYKAVNEEVLREHGRRGSFPVDNILEVCNIISPATATSPV